MDIERLRLYCLSKPGVTEDFPFDEDTLVFRILGKIFACINLGCPDHITLKCDPDYAISLRDRYDCIKGAWHWNKRHWNDVRFADQLSDDLVLSLVDHAYDAIRRKLPKKTLYNFPDLPEGWTHEHLPSVDSALSYLRAKSLPEGGRGQLVTTDFQTAGYGQVGTRWESADCANLLFSFRCPVQRLQANHFFLLSEALALSVAKIVKRYVGGHVSIKWPNDIYYRDQKIAGLLVETKISGTEITEVLVGVGLNVNQQTFEGDAPNPISMYQIMHREIDRAAVLRQLLKHWERYLALLISGDEAAIRDEYATFLYRRKGFYAYRDAEGTFKAEIVEVRPDGQLLLRDEQQNLRTYYFKEVQIVR